MIRYAILTAVSSTRQAAEDKISLELQESSCRTRAASKGWQEAAGPFVIPGASRTQYVNLQDAEADIPAIKDALDAAQRGEYDVLMVYDYTRLRELIDPVTRTLAAYGVQTYSFVQAVDPVPPAEFTRRLSGAASLVQAVSVITSRAEIEAMTRRTHSGRVDRVHKGLHPSGSIPFGYKYAPGFAHQKSPVIIDPPKAAIVVEIKDLYLSGKSTGQISAILFERGIPTPLGRPKWRTVSLLELLRNPFYIGEVGIGYTSVRRDPRSNKRGRAVTGTPITAQGQHQPLWDVATRNAILSEMQRRSRVYKGHRTYRLSSLLYCSIHNCRLTICLINSGGRDTEFWACKAIHGTPEHKIPWHVKIKNQEAVVKIAAQLADDLREIQSQISHPTEDPRNLLNATLKDLQRRRTRLADALESGDLDKVTYSTRIQAIDARLKENSEKLEKFEASQLERQTRLQTLTNLVKTISETPDYITSAPAQAVNQQLRSLIEKITISPTDEIKIIYRP